MDMKVGIIGSGIGALASAIELRKLGLIVEVLRPIASSAEKL
jgi:phytoene dehydrogenase-like protein